MNALKDFFICFGAGIGILLACVLAIVVVAVVVAAIVSGLQTLLGPGIQWPKLHLSPRAHQALHVTGNILMWTFAIAIFVCFMWVFGCGMLGHFDK